MEPMATQHNDLRVYNTSFDRRWEQLKPILEPLFYQLKLSEIVLKMKNEYGHDAKCVCSVALFI